MEDKMDHGVRVKVKLKQTGEKLLKCFGVPEIRTNVVMTPFYKEGSNGPLGGLFDYPEAPLEVKRPLKLKERLLILRKRIEKGYRNIMRKIQYNVRIEAVNVDLNDPASVVLIPTDPNEAKYLIKDLNSSRYIELHSAEFKNPKRPGQRLFDETGLTTSSPYDF